MAEQTHGQKVYELMGTVRDRVQNCGQDGWTDLDASEQAVWEEFARQLIGRLCAD